MPDLVLVKPCANTDSLTYFSYLHVSVNSLPKVTTQRYPATTGTRDLLVTELMACHVSRQSPAVHRLDLLSAVAGLRDSVHAGYWHGVR